MKVLLSILFVSLISFTSSQVTPSKQTKSQTVKGDQSSFYVILDSSDSVPSFYLYANNDINDKQFKLSCSQDNTNRTKVNCYPYRVTDGTYTIYFIDDSNSITSTGITIIYTAPISITILSVVSVCSESPFDSFSFTIDKQPTGSISIIILTKLEDSSTVVFSQCHIDSLTVTCDKSDKEITPGTYSLTSLAGADMYVISSSAGSATLIYEPNPFGKQIDSNPTINNDNLYFTIMLSSEDTEIPSMTTRGMKVVCTKEKTKANCFIDGDVEFNGNIDYDIYYTSKCGVSDYTNITVKTSFIDINVKRVVLNDNTTCHTDNIKEIYITVDKEPTGSIREAILINENEDKFYFDSCSYKSTVITCKSDNAITEEGKYTLNAMIGADQYHIEKEATFEIKKSESVLGEQIETEPLIKDTNVTFTIVLASKETEAPKIYVDEEDEIECVKEEEKLICTPNDRNMPISMEYDIFYKDVCNNMVNTGIVVTKVKGEISFTNEARRISIRKGFLFSLFLILFI